MLGGTFLNKDAGRFCKMPDDYKETLNLPKTSFPMKANLAKKELDIKKGIGYTQVLGRHRYISKAH